VAFALMLGTSFDVFAQATTGKISGRATEKASGEPLPGVNIVLVGTRQGATADTYTKFDASFFSSVHVLTVGIDF